MLRISPAMPSRRLKLPAAINRLIAATIWDPPPRVVARKSSVSVSVIVPSKSEKRCSLAMYVGDLSSLAVDHFDAGRWFEIELCAVNRNVLAQVREDKIGSRTVGIDNRDPRNLQ